MRAGAGRAMLGGTSYLHQAILAFINPMVSSSFFVCAKTWEEKSCLQRKRLFVEWTAGPYTAENSYLLSVEYLPLHAGWTTLRFRASVGQQLRTT